MRKYCRGCPRFLLLGEFYKHPQMGDGHLNFCKDCIKHNVSARYWRDVENSREYENCRHKRRLADSGYIAHLRERVRKYRRINPHKHVAHQMVSKALLSGAILRGSCEVCGTTEYVHAHHDDYSRPLDVKWLCAADHKARHRELDSLGIIP